MEPPGIPAGIAAAAREMTPGGVMRTGASAEVTAATREMSPARGVTAAATAAVAAATATVAAATAAVLGKRRRGADQDRPQNAGC